MLELLKCILAVPLLAVIVLPIVFVVLFLVVFVLVELMIICICEFAGINVKKLFKRSKYISIYQRDKDFRESIFPDK